MSAAKIEKEIKLLEKELAELNNNVSDPIERNEYKKEIQRKLKKLNRTKRQIQQQEIEQQELESLKLEFILNSDKVVETEEQKPDSNQQIETAKEEELASTISSQSFSAN